ncbi:MAG TPA: D-alanyl-D-alanine carboxypeptidase, partial [Candidatus Paceibacterota bacterium]
MKSYKKIFSYIVFPTLAVGSGILITAFLLNFTSNLKLSWSEKNTASAEITTLKTEVVEVTPENKIGYFLKDIEKNPKLTTDSYLIGDIDTGEIIFDKNTDTAFPVASVSKLMTALVALETLEMNKEI